MNNTELTKETSGDSKDSKDSKDSTKIPYSKWSALSENEQEFLKKLGFTLLRKPGAQAGNSNGHKERKKVLAPLKEYTIAIHYVCELCGNKHAKYGIMEYDKENHALVMRTIELDEFQDIKYEKLDSKVRLHRTSSCPCCHGELSKLSKDELITKIIRIKNIYEKISEDEQIKKSVYYWPDNFFEDFSSSQKGLELKQNPEINPNLIFDAVAEYAERTEDDIDNQYNTPEEQKELVDYEQRVDDIMAAQSDRTGGWIRALYPGELQDRCKNNS